MDVAQSFNVALHVPRLTRTEMMEVLKQLGAFDGPDVSALLRLIWLLRLHVAVQPAGANGCVACCRQRRPAPALAQRSGLAGSTGAASMP